MSSLIAGRATLTTVGVEEDDGGAEDRRDEGQALLAGHLASVGRWAGSGPRGPLGLVRAYPWKGAAQKRERKGRGDGETIGIQGSVAGPGNRRCVLSFPRGRDREDRPDGELWRRHRGRLPLSLRGVSGPHSWQVDDGRADRARRWPGQPLVVAARQLPGAGRRLRPRQRRRSVGRRRDPGPKPALADLSAAGIAVRGAEDAVQLRVEWPRSPTALPSVPEFIDVPGSYGFNAISPDGATAYLTHYRVSRDHEAGTKPSDDFEIRALDLESGRLAPRPLARAPRQRGPLTGVPITRVSSGDGRWAYTLYLGDRRPVYLLALDTVAGRAIPVELPRLPGPANAPANALSLRLRLEAGGRRLTVFSRSPDLGGARPLVRVDTSTYTAQPARAIRRASARSHPGSRTRTRRPIPSSPSRRPLATPATCWPGSASPDIRRRGGGSGCGRPAIRG